MNRFLNVGIWIIFSLIVFSSFTIAQSSDTIFTFRNKIPCTISKISTKKIKYFELSTKEEKVIYTSQIKKIVFKNGASQLFNKSSKIKEVRYAIDWKNVYTAKKENELASLSKYGTIKTKVWYRNLESTKKRVKEHVRILAAMYGCNAITKIEFKVHKDLIDVSATAYIDSFPNFDLFKTILEKKTKFKSTSKFVLSNNGLSIKEAYSHFIIKKTTIKNGIIYLYGDLGIHQGEFRLVYLGADYFVVLFVSESGKAFNYVLNY